MPDWRPDETHPAADNSIVPPHGAGINSRLDEIQAAILRTPAVAAAAQINGARWRPRVAAAWPVRR
jgi:hypothetical protein